MDSNDRLIYPGVLVEDSIDDSNVSSRQVINTQLLHSTSNERLSLSVSHSNNGKYTRKKRIKDINARHIVVRNSTSNNNMSMNEVEISNIIHDGNDDVQVEYLKYNRFK